MDTFVTLFIGRLRDDHFGDSMDHQSLTAPTPRFFSNSPLLPLLSRMFVAFIGGPHLHLSHFLHNADLQYDEPVSKLSFRLTSRTIKKPGRNLYGVKGKPRCVPCAKGRGKVKDSTLNTDVCSANMEMESHRAFVAPSMVRQNLAS